MRKLWLIWGLLAFLLAACGSQENKMVTVEIIHLNHAPILPTVQEVEAVLAEYGDSVSWQLYDFDTDEGKAFAEEHDLIDHTPIAIFVNGEMEVDLNGRSVKFYSFPEGEGVGDLVTEGVWTLADLRAVLDQATE